MATCTEASRWCVRRQKNNRLLILHRWGRPKTRRCVQAGNADRPAKWPVADRSRLGQPFMRSQDFQAVETTATDRDFLVVGAVLQNQSPKPKFPANREKNREFCEKLQFGADSLIE
jgi:hypothetical protein